MSRAWFHRRDPRKGEGIGYGPATWQGLVATFVFVAALIAITIGITRLGAGWAYTPVVAGVFFVGAIIGFLLFVHSHSDEDEPLWPPT